MVKPGNEALADAEDRLKWYQIFSKNETTEDIEWVRELIEETENDQDESFSFDNWPGELETLGSIQWDALAVQRNIRKERATSGNIPEGKRP